MSPLTDHEVINTLDHYNFLNLGGDPTPGRDIDDWIIEPLDISDFPDARNDEIMSNNDVPRRDVENYEINEGRLRDVIVNTTRRDLPPPTDIDALAWYLPIHYYGPEWGIYLREDAIETFAGHIWDRLRQRTGSSQELRQVWQAAAFTLYLHEAFHHKMESFAIRLEMARLQRTYIPYFENVYRASRGTNHQLEEIIATYEMYRRLSETTYKNKLSREVRNATLRFLEQFIPTLPPSYRLGLTGNPSEQLNNLCSQISEASLTPGRPADDWKLTPNMTRSIFNRTTVVYVLIPKKRQPGGGGGAALLGLDRRSVDRFLTRQAGYSVNTRAGKGGHIKYVHETKPMVILPSARELSRPVIKSISSTLDYDTVREFANAVREFS